MPFSETLKACVIQWDVKAGDVPANLEIALLALGRAGRRGVQLAVLPELWSCGFDHENLPRHGEATPEILEILSQTARSLGMAIAGSLPETIEGRLYNTLIMVDADGSVAGTYRKIHLFAAGGEAKTFTPGSGASICQTSLGPIGGIICYDLRFPELCRLLALQGARIIVVCAQWPSPRIGHWDILLQARAIENQVFVLGANRIGSHGRLIFPGRSKIVSPFGEILSQADDTASEAVAELSFKDMETFRGLFHCLEERRPEAYGPLKMSGCP